MKEKNINKLSLSLLILGIVFIFIGIFIFVSGKESVKNEPTSFEDIINDCKNLDLEDTSICFRDNIKTFFKYDNDGVEIHYDKSIKYYVSSNTFFISNDTSDVFNYLRENGGECEEWTMFYEILFENTNYNYSKVYEDNHVYNLIKSDKEICLIDQLNVRCYK